MLLASQWVHLCLNNAGPQPFEEWKWCVLGMLTHRGRVTHICVSKLTIIGSDNGLSPGRRKAIIWTNDGILLIWTFRTHFSEIVSEIHTFSFKKMYFKMSSGKWRLSCLGLNVLTGMDPLCHYEHHQNYSIFVSFYYEFWYSDELSWGACVVRKRNTRHVCIIHLDKMSLIARFTGPTWGPPGAARTQVGPMLAPWTLLSRV